MFVRLKPTLSAMMACVLVCTVVLAHAPAVHAAGMPSVVESFQEDRVHLDIGDTTHVTRTLVIRNDINRSIVPGEITLVLQKQSPARLGPVAIPFTGSLRPVNVTNVAATLGNGTAITDVKVTESENATTIRYGAWLPIEPGRTLTVVLAYDSPDIVEKGLLFSTVEYPFTSSSIPVENAIVEASVAHGHVTHASPPPAASGNAWVWEKPQLGMDSWAVSFEYSALPLPLLPVSGGVLLWGPILLACLAWVAWTYARPRKKP